MNCPLTATGVMTQLVCIPRVSQGLKQDLVVPASSARDPEYLLISKNTVESRKPLNQALSAFKINPQVYDAALAMLGDDFVRSSHVCSHAACVFSYKRPGQPSRIRMCGEQRQRVSELFFWCNSSDVADAETKSAETSEPAAGEPDTPLDAAMLAGSNAEPIDEAPLDAPGASLGRELEALIATVSRLQESVNSLETQLAERDTELASLRSALAGQQAAIE